MKSLPFALRILLLVWLAQIPSLFIYVLSSDEPTWTALAREIFSGRFYIDISDNKPPLHFELYWLASLGGASLYSVKVFLIIWLTAAALAARELGREMGWSAKESDWVAIIFAFICGYSNNGAVSGEKLMLLPLICSLWAILRTRHRLTGAVWFTVLSGAALSAAMNIKPTAGVFLPLIAILAIHGSWQRSFVSLLGVAVGGLSVTIISWALVGVPFQIIYQEAIGIAVQYTTSAAPVAFAEIAHDLLGNIFLMLGLWYLPAVALAAIGLFHLRGRRNAFIAATFLLLSFAAVSVSFRFYQQYFPVLVPALSLLGALGMMSLRERRQKILVGILIALLCGHHAWTFVRQFQDKNRNWNSLVQEAVQDVRQVTKPGDRAWVTSSVYSLYVLNDLKPAVKYQLWLYYFGFQDSCRVPQDALTEDRATRSTYSDLIRRLEENPPKVIYWTSRHENNCSDKFKIENMPSLQKFVLENYDLHKKSDLGFLYLRK